MPESDILKTRMEQEAMRARQVKLWRPEDAPQGEIPSGLRALPGRIVAWIPKQETRRGILMPGYNGMDADCGYVMSSGVAGIERGDVAILRYRAGMRLLGSEYGDNEVAIIGGPDAPLDWNLMGVIRNDRIITGENWRLVRRDDPEENGILLRHAAHMGTCIHTGQRVGWTQWAFNNGAALQVQEWTEDGLYLVCLKAGKTDYAAAFEAE